MTNITSKEIVREAADAIHRNSQIQIKIMTDLLDISKGITGKMVLDATPIELNSVLQEILKTACETAKQKHIEFLVRTEGEGSMIQGDSIRLSQVIWNLLSNAIKFTAHGGKIEVRLLRKDQWLELSVQDNGVGIDPDFIPHIFERFHQQDALITKNFGGLGLGLAIVKHIVDLHGGRVQVHSDGIGRGSTFSVQFPALPN